MSLRVFDILSQWTRMDDEQLRRAIVAMGGDSSRLSLARRLFARAVETPGGWQDFIRQNPGFFGALSKAETAKSTTQKSAPAKTVAKLTYKDQRRLEELESLIAEGPTEIAKLETSLADPGLYGRDPATFDRLTKALVAKQGQVAAAEEEWLALEERRETLASAR